MEIKEGTYTLEGNKIFIEGKQLAVLERKKDIERKPKNYLAVLFQSLSIFLDYSQKGKKGNLFLIQRKNYLSLSY